MSKITKRKRPLQRPTLLQPRIFSRKHSPRFHCEREQGKSGCSNNSAQRMLSLPAESAFDIRGISLGHQKILDELDYGRTKDCPQIINIKLRIFANLGYILCDIQRQ